MEEVNIINFPDMKLVDNDFEVDFGVEFCLKDTKNYKKYIGISQNSEQLGEVNVALDLNDKHFSELNSEINRLTNSSDGIDYVVAVCSGVLAGIIDSFCIGEFDFKKGKDLSVEKVNNLVKKAAKMNGYTGDNLEGAIRHLEKGFGAPSDSVKDKFGAGLQHHLRDFAHHPTLVGLFFSMFTQFSGKSYGTDTNGLFIIVDVEIKVFIGKDVPQKFLFGTVFWFLHMISDMAGSSSNPGAGTGLPGPILSLLKEISALPFFDNLKNDDGVKNFSLWISKLFNGTLLSEHDETGKIVKESAQLMKFDLRAELGVAYELGRMSRPVILNECIVRSFYFIRKLSGEIKDKKIIRFKELRNIDLHKIMPIKNRTIVRMLTIATGTFTLVDIADSAFRSAFIGKVDTADFPKEFLLHVNFVGLGRFTIGIGTDATMDVKREKLRYERFAIFSEQLHLMNVKVYYLQADSWILAEETKKTIDEAYKLMQMSSGIFLESWKEKRELLGEIGELSEEIKQLNENLIEDISDVLTWGVI